MEIQGTVEQILPVESGVSKTSNKEWRKGGFILTTEGQYPKKICVTLFGKPLDEVRVAVGQRVTAHVDVSSRSWTSPATGKTSWFTEVSAYRVDAEQTAAPAPQYQQPPVQQPQPQQISAYEQANALYGGAFPGATAQPPQSQSPQGADDLPF